MANAENTIPTDEIWYTSINGNVVNPFSSSVFGATIQSNTYEDGKGVIKFNGPVTSIGEYAFYVCSSLTSVTIPESVTSIGYSAFNFCSSLTSVTIPESVTSIGDDAFNGCDNISILTFNTNNIGTHFSGKKKLSTVNIGESVTSIAESAFESCSGLTSVTIPEPVTSIGENAFWNCSGLTSVTFAEDSKLTSIGTQAFYGCSGLTSVTIPESVTSIGENAFRGCSGLTYNEYGNALYLGNIDNSYLLLVKAKSTDMASCEINPICQFIHSGAFSDCRSLASVTIPNSVTSIGNYAFYDCRSLASITIPNSVTNIGSSAFSGCTSLVSVSFPEISELKSIGEFAFYDCSSLTSITIPNSVTSIGVCAFGRCTASIIYCQATEKPFGWEDDWNVDNRPVAWGCKVVNLSANDNTFGTVSGGGLFPTDSSINISAIPAKHCHLVKWSDGDTENPRTIKVTTDTTLIAVFAIDTFKITAYTENGTVSGAGKFAYGTSASLTATPAEHYHFAKWSDGNTENPRTIAVTSDMAFTAMFAIDTLKVTASAENGTVFGAGNYIYGTSALLVATPAEHYHFAKWSDGNTENPRTITVTEDIALEAIFEKADDISTNAVSALAIYANHNVIVVENADADIYIYDAMGRLVARRDVARNVSTEITMQNAGIYIVKVGNEAKKVMTW